MHPEEQQRILKTLKHGLEKDISADAEGILRVPVSDFTSKELLQKEQQVFFRETPLLMGLSTDLPDSGSYLATFETGVPILMTRDGRGDFNAFLNVCRHRGVQVVPNGRGSRDRFSCPFHAWTYDNSGELVAINRERKFGRIDKRDHGLVALQAREAHGMLWVKPSPGDGFDLDEVLGGLGPEMSSWQLDTHDFEEEQVIDADVNWKLAIDTFGENYHFDVLHRDTLAPEIHGNLQTSDVFGQNYRMVFASKNGFKYVADNNVPEQEWPYRLITLNVYFLYPNVILLVDPMGVDILRMYPEGNDPARSKTRHRFYINPAVQEHRRQLAQQSGENEPVESRFEGFNRIVVDEDYAVAASTQKNASSGAQTHYLFGRNEPALHHYHNAHRRGLGLPLLELMTTG
jgi:phenylpropionate dioxygenase-like ring-hydroxylating dioxygenase large terminal subunit